MFLQVGTNHAREIEKIVKEYKEITFIKFNCDQLEKLTALFRKFPLPTFILFKKWKNCE
jgi:thiol-disulfide isomerase/thioredoxin